MSLRELIILLLGLAIIGIILRGLFVALQTRRGQLRIAIDKNIPTDVDLDSLELAELPGGGARVVRRDGALQEGTLGKLERATAYEPEQSEGKDERSEHERQLVGATSLLSVHLTVSLVH